MSYEDEEIERLILLGALEPVGIDAETGEFLYNFTDKLASINPELHKDISLHLYTETMYLWSHGFLDMDITSSNPIIKLGPSIVPTSFFATSMIASTDPFAAMMPPY